MVPRTSQINQDSESSANRRNSMATCRSSETSHPNRRYTTNSVQLRDTVEMLRLLDDSINSPEKDSTPSEKPNIALPMPLMKTQRGFIGPRSSSVRASRRQVHPASAEEINAKVAEMMAAMDALKPSTPTRTATDSRALAQVAQSKGLAKLLGRLYSKSASPDNEALKKRSKTGAGDGDVPLTKSASQSDKNQSSISSTKIRLNEDQNLNRNKVQQIIGGKVIQKHANSTLLSGNSDSFVAIEGRPGEDRQVAGSKRVHDTRRMSWPSANPFDTEEDFECDLDQGILHASPAGSSTPRIRIHRTSDSTLSEYSIKDLSGASLGQVNLAKVVQIGKNDKTNKWIRQLNFGPAADKRHSPIELPSRNGDEGTAKKHPSPSKRDLEELEKAFRQYELPQGTYEDGGVDELAASRTVLSVKDRN
ncbi:hypothetical protein EsDP_00001708 [Epichloe bromicola]|uniref:Uncharacterized protein n=1 Tax=Epichloe bromicola TaxID=79588 RepID=A0ABQ0CIM9_9HYPO